MSLTYELKGCQYITEVTLCNARMISNGERDRKPKHPSSDGRNLGSGTRGLLARVDLGR